MDNSDKEYYICGLCEDVVLGENMEKHKCFNPTQEDNNNDNEINNSQELRKTNMIWDHDKTLALLTIYEMEVEKVHPKAIKKRLLWQRISEQLTQMGVIATSDQVSWKINALLQHYKKCKDDNKKTGRSPTTFLYYDRLDNIFHNRESDANVQTTSTQLPELPTKKIKLEINSESPSTSRGNPSNLEDELLNYIRRNEKKREEDRALKEKLRKKQLESREKAREERDKRHKELLKVETLKCDLLKALLEKANKNE